MLAAAVHTGAIAGVRDGWMVPVSFGDEAAELRALGQTVGVADASPLLKTEMHGEADVISALAGGLKFGTALPSARGWWCPLAPTRALLIGAPPVSSQLAGISTVDVTSQFCAIRIGGPRTRELVSRFCALDLRPQVAPPRSVRPGSVARTPGLVLVETTDRLLILVGAAYAEYLWTVVTDAAMHLDGRPVGWDLLHRESIRPEETPAHA